MIFCLPSAARPNRFLLNTHVTVELVDQMLAAGPLPEPAVTISQPEATQTPPAETTTAEPQTPEQPAVESEPVVEPLPVALPILEPVPVAIPVTEEPAAPIEAAESEPTEEAQKPSRKRIAPEVVAEGKKLLAEGVKGREVARRLGVSPSTVRT